MLFFLFFVFACLPIRTPKKSYAIMSAPKVDEEENRRRMKAGELYYAFTPGLIADRKRCKMVQDLYNNSDGLTRREQVEIYQK